ncbi:GSCOCT00006887001.2-RA-CDS [Cotesia congregata]|uniref:Gustatory receptor n=1 Tax=Cotesia congregata TaxID=51543 RepID=A0A8J2HD00_COTCN|nr:GSCOCT00006887001.2-RA-CDS [Cotesia congregata]CAG5089518.1 gustatory receptor 40 [Cotesia congregata]
MSYHKIKSVCYRLFVISQYLFLKLIGLSPWSIEASEIIRRNRRIESHNFKYTFSYVGIFYNFVFIFLTVSLSIYVVFYLQQTYSEEIKLFETLFLSSSVLCMVFIVLIYTIRQKVPINLINNRLKSVDKNLNSCADYKSKNYYANDWIFLMNFVFNFCVTILRYLAFKSDIIVFIMLVPNILTTWPLIHYTIFINLIRRRFEEINSTLLKLGTSESKISHSRELILDDFTNLKRAYEEICKGCDEIVNFYEIFILIVSSIMAIRLVRNLYFIIVKMINLPTIDVIIFLVGVTLLQYVINFIMLTIAVTKVIEQNKKTPIILNLLRDRFDMDEEIFKTISSFYIH